MLLKDSHGNIAEVIFLLRFLFFFRVYWVRTRLSEEDWWKLDSNARPSGHEPTMPIARPPPPWPN